MVVYNENGDRIESPNLDAGYVEPIQIRIYHAYVVDVPAVTHEVVIAEYPETGGKDVEIVEDEPEQGHWETRYEDGSLVEDYDGGIPEGLPKGLLTPDAWDCGIYHTYTAEELAEIEEARREAEAVQAKAEEQQAWLDQAPRAMLDIDEELCAVYEQQMAMQLDIDELITNQYEQEA